MDCARQKPSALRVARASGIACGRVQSRVLTSRTNACCSFAETLIQCPQQPEAHVICRQLSFRDRPYPLQRAVTCERGRAQPMDTTIAGTDGGTCDWAVHESAHLKTGRATTKGLQTCTGEGWPGLQLHAWSRHAQRCGQGTVLLNAQRIGPTSGLLTPLYGHIMALTCQHAQVGRLIVLRLHPP